MMHALEKPVAGDEPCDPVRHCVVLYILMSQAEMELWEGVAGRRRLPVDDVVHAVALCGLKEHLRHAGDELGAHAAEACTREVLAQLVPVL